MCKPGMLPMPKSKLNRNKKVASRNPSAQVSLPARPVQSDPHPKGYHTVHTLSSQCSAHSGRRPYRSVPGHAHAMLCMPRRFRFPDPT
jgi:hypothetical protein